MIDLKKSINQTFMAKILRIFRGPLASALPLGRSALIKVGLQTSAIGARGMSSVSGLMQFHDLTIASLMEHGAKVFGDTEIVSRTIEDPTKFHRYTYSEAEKRSKKVANALGKLGVVKGDRVATIAWNGYRHFELYYGVSGSGAILHTINPRLHPDLLVYILNHAEDKVLFVDLTFYKGAVAVLPKLKSLKALVIMTDRANMPEGVASNVLCYEELIAAEGHEQPWPKVKEGDAAALCYTSGTTGNPKGVLYNHRSTVLHAISMCTGNSCGFMAQDTVLPVVPMFHVNAWGIPYSACISGCKLVFPGSAMDGKSIFEALAVEKVNKTAGVPTVYSLLLQHMDSAKVALPHLEEIVIGGSVCPPSMIRAFDKHNITAVHAWGMTEMSPTGVVNTPRFGDKQRTPEERMHTRVRQGRQMYGVELKVVDQDGKECARDGKSSGNLLVRGNWVCSGYYKLEESALDEEGWFDTGDMAFITPDGYLQITDRAKDMIKSGGEWISSIDIENIALEYPGVASAALVGVPSAKWGERPLLILVKAQGAEEPDKSGILSLIAGKVHKMCVPDDIVFIDEMPLGGTGKILKRTLRDRFATHALPKA